MLNYLKDLLEVYGKIQEIEIPCEGGDNIKKCILSILSSDIESESIEVIIRDMLRSVTIDISSDKDNMVSFMANISRYLMIRETMLKTPKSNNDIKKVIDISLDDTYRSPFIHCAPMEPLQDHNK